MIKPAELAAEYRVFNSAVGTHLFVTNGSRIYDIDPESAGQISQLLTAGDGSLDLLRETGLYDLTSEARYITAEPLAPPDVFSISLNVAQACNMACAYCYANEGKFGGSARMMGLDVAKATVDRLIADSAPGANLLLGYMGGEPMLNRKLIHETTRYAAQAARAAGRRIQFSLTTNATMLQAEDVQLFTEFPFTVQVSIDGDREQHDAVRVLHGGAGTYDLMMANLDLFRQYGRPKHFSARVTVTPKTGELLPTLNHLMTLGFDEVGFAAVLVSPNPDWAFGPEEFPLFTERMIACGERALGELKAGRPYPFGNFETAMMEIHRGSHRPYPCGAGAGYLSASAEGNLFACHRLVDDEAYAMGSVQEGVDTDARSTHLAKSHVDLQEPCNTCWARYLCGGGCYHEVSRRGRIGCDYIRGWLDFCLQAYVELITERPDYFAALSAHVPERLSSPTTVG